MTHKMLLEVPETVYQSLIETAKQLGQRPETVAVQWLTRATKTVPLADPLDELIGVFSSNLPDWGDQHDFYLGQNLMAKSQGRLETHE